MMCPMIVMDVTTSRLLSSLTTILWLLGCSQPVAVAQTNDVSDRFQALQIVTVPTGSTWVIADRDGAGREVEPYLSSLGLGETATGVIASPAFLVSTGQITFTIRGHDGQPDGHEKNFIALVDEKTGEILTRTMAPGHDALQARAWDVDRWKGRRVRIEVHDGIADRDFAWLGIGSIDAGSELALDFRKGLPDRWQVAVRAREVDTQPVDGLIPFLALRSAYTLVPADKVAEIPCGFEAKRLFLLGCTVARGRPLETYGWVEIVYEDGPSERIPLVYGFNLDGEQKLPSQSAAMHIHPAGVPFQYCLPIRTRPGLIRAIRFSGNAGAVPRITAISVETNATSDHLVPLPAHALSDEEEAWIRSHTISVDAPNRLDIEAKIRASHKLRGLRFERTKISDRSFEAASACDIDNDGNLDIVSGGYWYGGPAFSQSHKIRDVPPAGEYWDDFSDYPIDVNGDAYVDIVTGAFFGRPLQWLENPKGTDGPWKIHDIEPVGPIETTRFWDVNGDGIVEVVPNAGGNVVFFRLVVDSHGKGTGQFTKHVVKMGGCGHGLGFGDINGDGRGDFVVPDGWLEAPHDPLAGEWIWHDDGFRLGSASVPIEVHDVNEDGKADLIVGQAHGYGLDWYEQSTSEDEKRSWTQHTIDRFGSQYHDMQLVDIDNDGRLELVTGKRYRAHNGHDPGSTDPIFIRYFEIDRGVFSSRMIDYGSHHTSSGVGIHFWIDDVDHNGWKDIIAPGKEGLYLFKSRGLESHHFTPKKCAT